MNNEKLSHLSSVALIVCSCAILFGTTLTGLNLNHEDYSYYENRNLFSRPKLSLEGIMDGSYFTDLDTYIKERSAKREAFLRFSTFIDLHVLHRPVVNDVVVTKESLLPFNEYEIVSDYNINY